MFLKNNILYAYYSKPHFYFIEKMAKYIYNTNILKMKAAEQGITGTVNVNNKRNQKSYTKYEDMMFQLIFI